LIMDTNKATYENTASVVMNDYIDGLGLIRSLRCDERVRIILVGRRNSIASRSKYPTELRLFETPDEQIRILEELNERFRVCVPFPAGDNYFRLLVKNRERLKRFSIPWETVALLEKDEQIKIARSVGIRIPESITMSSMDESDRLDRLELPVIIKPLSRPEGERVFKAEIATSKDEVFGLCRRSFERSIPVIISEFVDGPDSSLYTYGGYARNGDPAIEYTGRKLMQVPHLRGVCGMGETVENPILLEQGRKFIARIGFTGMFQVEMKLCAKTGEFYYIEFNPRNWFWSYLATREGINIPLCRYYCETGLLHVQRTEGKPRARSRVFIWGDSVLYNLFVQRWAGALVVLLKNLFRRKVWAVIERGDMRPFVRNILNNARLLTKDGRKAMQALSGR